MPKTRGGLWDEVVSFDNLYAAFREARKGHIYKPEVLSFQSNLEENLINIQNHLIYQTWEPGPWRQFCVRDPKYRLIQAPCFSDRVVHHALVDVVNPLFERKMIYHSYACRANKGVHGAAAQVQKNTRIAARNWGRSWVLKADISKYFPSIDHNRLLAILPRTLREPQVLWLFEVIIRNSGFDGKGIPVGALTSQLLANIYLDQLDHRIKDNMGIRHYVRYMDDFIIVGQTKADLVELLDWIRTYLSTDLSLSMNPKTEIFPAASRLVDFAGYRICPTHMLPRKRNVKRTRQAFKKMSKNYEKGVIDLDYVSARVASFLGYTKHCCAFRTTKSVLGELVLTSK